MIMLMYFWCLIKETEEDDVDEELEPKETGEALTKRKRPMDIPKVSVNKNGVGRRVPPHLSENAEPRVDVRMIDFAHTTFSKRRGSATPVHLGPDCGFLTGLDSLKKLLTEILAEENDVW